MRHAIVAGTLLSLAFGLLGCAEKGTQPAFAAFRYVTEDGQDLAVGGPTPAELVDRGILIRQDHTTLPDGRRAVQQIWVVDPLEIPPAEYRVYMTKDGYVAISGGSFQEFVLTPPAF